MEPKKLPLQLEFVGRLKKSMIEWAEQKKIRLQTIEYVIPFVLTDKSLSIWLFYDTNQTKNSYEDDGTHEEVKNKCLNFLMEFNYPKDYLKEVNFFTDSDENVKENYEGSYFFRLR